MATGEATVTSSVAPFDFISDQRFRDSLVADYGEIATCLERRAWKAVHVLAGSIIEAILVDYLVTSDYKKKSGQDPLTFDLFKAIEACKAEGVLSNRAAELSSVIRGYRNLIHPGRVVRLNEKIDANSGIVAKALVDMVIDEIRAGRKQKYGYTAEQILLKLESDDSALSIFSHLLNETNEFERARLILEVLPDRYFFYDNHLYPVAERLRTAFRRVFDSLPDEIRTKAVKRFVTILKEQPGEEVLKYETAFFQGRDLKYLTTQEAALVKEHLLHRLGSEITVELCFTAVGMASFLNPSETARYIHILIRAMVRGKGESIRNIARSTLSDEYYYSQLEQQERIKSLVDSKRLEYSEADLGGTANMLKELLDSWSEEIPF